MTSSVDNWPDVKYRHLVREAKLYRVYLDDVLDIEWETKDEYEPKDRAKFNVVIHDAAFLETAPCDHLSEHIKRDFKRLIGEGIALGLSHDYANAERALNTARSYILARNQETSRFWYLSAATMTTVPMVVIGTVLWVVRDVMMPVLGTVAFWLVMASVAGSVGSLLSVILRTGRQQLDCSAGKPLHYLEGASRIGAGALSGIIAALAVQAEMILALVSRGNKMTATMVLAGFAAGAVERFAPSIISTIGASQPQIAQHRNDESSE